MNIVESPKSLTDQVSTTLTHKLDLNKVPIHSPLFISQLGPYIRHTRIGHYFISFNKKRYFKAYLVTNYVSNIYRDIQAYLYIMVKLFPYLCTSSDSDN